MGQLDGRVALVTGGARGQGRSHALALAAEGAHVVVCDIADQIPSVPYPLATREDLETTVSLIRDRGGAATPAVVDVRSSEAVARLVEDTVAQHGRVDILVANAAVTGFARVTDIDDATWHDVIDTNLTGAFYCIRAVLPHMLRQRYGRIVAISSGAGRAGMAELGHYAASKWGLIGLVKTVALEVATEGITANIVCPTTVATPMVHNPATLARFCPDIETPTVEDARPRFAALTPMRRAWLEPEEVTRAVMYLVTDPGCTSGSVIEVNLATSASRT
ncbi:MAG: mycofactocin-coupled SDR family oxidoreductase [Micromonosporaceae bacterium]|nr:mycofactocin-coupled SDR family oxidoreductase [Micromonosporaceae bacterium]